MQMAWNSCGLASLDHVIIAAGAYNASWGFWRIHTLAYKTGRRKPTSATGCPVSFVPINPPVSNPYSLPCPKKK